MSSDSEPYSRPPFPTYLLPSLSFPSPSALSFRRRKSSTTSTSTNNTTTPSLATSPSSPSWSPITTPSSSPPSTSYLAAREQRFSLSSLTAAVSSTIFRTDSRTSTSTGRGSLSDPSQKVTLVRNAPDTLKCSTCATDLAFSSQIVSKGFTGRYGRAYLVAASPIDPPSTSAMRTAYITSPAQQSRSSSRSRKTADGIAMTNPNLINVKVGRPTNRQLVTGAHVVADISCTVCERVVGWKYVDAKEPAQKYKIGKFILETKRVVRGTAWEDGLAPPARECGLDGNPEGAENETDEEDNDITVVGKLGKDEVVFESDDEEECEELFSGVWDRETVRKRRIKRMVKKGKR